MPALAHRIADGKDFSHVSSLLRGGCVILAGRARRFLLAAKTPTAKCKGSAKAGTGALLFMPGRHWVWAVQYAQRRDRGSHAVCTAGAAQASSLVYFKEENQPDPAKVGALRRY